MQYGPKNNDSFFIDWAKQKQQYKMNQWEFFNSVFSFKKLGDSSITVFSVVSTNS